MTNLTKNIWDGTFIRASLQGDFPVALTKNDMDLHTAALYFGQGIKSVSEDKNHSMRSISACGVGSDRQTEYSIPSS